MIFLDIGSHEGQTLEEVTRDRWGFTEIHAVEPMPREAAILQQRFGDDPRVLIHRFALMDYTGHVTMYGANDQLEASVYSGKLDVDPDVRTTVECTRATEFFTSLPEAELYVDMNCEGAEVPILDDLVASGEIHRITHMLVSFDITRVRDFEQQAARVKVAMLAAGFTRWRSVYPDRPTHQEQIAAWLEEAGA